MALSIGLPRLGVTQHRALWSSDFPRTAFRFPCSDETGLWENAARDRLACFNTDLTITHTTLIVKYLTKCLVWIIICVTTTTEKDDD